MIFFSSLLLQAGALPKQLGADRGGFYSYDFIERAMGYKTRHQDLVKPEFKDIKVGNLVRGSIDEKSSLIPYNFRVLYVQPEETFVLDKWGTFLVEAVNIGLERSLMIAYFFCI